jgi:nicotinamidase/pyrazinamidase
MKRILIDVDTQHDFMHPEGSLHVPAAPSVREAIRGVLESGGYDAVVGSVDSHAYDAWEFEENGGPFPPHCVKGTRGWMRTFENLPARRRFVPMAPYAPVLEDRFILVGEGRQGEGPRRVTPDDLALEAVDKKVGLYFEKEVYSLFDNPFAMPVLSSLGRLLGGDWNNIQIDVVGYCTGGYCVDAAVRGLCEEIGVQRASVRVLAYATAAIGGDEGMEKSRRELTALGAEWVEAP